MERKDVPQNLKWKTTDIFESDEAWEAEFKAVESEYGGYDFDVFKGKLADKKTLLEYLVLDDTLSLRIEKLYLYAHMRQDEDVRVAKYSSCMAMMERSCAVV